MNMQQFKNVIDLFDNMAAVCREHQDAPNPGEFMEGDYLGNIDGFISFCRNNVHVYLRNISMEEVSALLWDNLRKPLAEAPTLVEDHQNWAVERLQQLLDAYQTAAQHTAQ